MDITLMQEVVQGDEAALRFLIECYRERLYRFAYSLLGDESAYDAVQETFIQLWTHARRYNPRHNLSTWLYTICCRECYDEMRRRKRRQKTIAAMPKITTEMSKLETDELQDLLRWATSELPPKQRVVYQLREIEEFDTEETALTTQMTPEQVKANLWAARKGVKEKLKEYGIQ